MARDLASAVGYRYIDSGAMYRAVALYALRHGMAHGSDVDIQALVAALPEIHIDFRASDDGQKTILNGEEVETLIRSMDVSRVVSPVAVIPQVRHALVAMQQAYGRQKGIVMDGRDIGTTVFPDAELKVFVDASAETRARRRFEELKAKGQTTPFEDVLANVRQRDHLDTTRSESPLRCAPDAIRLDNSHMTRAEQLDHLMTLFHKASASAE